MVQCFSSHPTFFFFLFPPLPNHSFLRYTLRVFFFNNKVLFLISAPGRWSPLRFAKLFNSSNLPQQHQRRSFNLILTNKGTSRKASRWIPLNGKPMPTTKELSSQPLFFEMSTKILLYWHKLLPPCLSLNVFPTGKHTNHNISLGMR